MVAVVVVVIVVGRHAVTILPKTGPVLLEGRSSRNLARRRQSRKLRLLLLRGTRLVVLIALIALIALSWVAVRLILVALLLELRIVSIILTVGGHEGLS